VANPEGALTPVPLLLLRMNWAVTVAVVAVVFCTAYCVKKAKLV
jgi:hypothetical protein